MFAIAYLGKKLGFHTKFCEFRDWRILKIGLFHLVKEFFKSIQTWCGVSPVKVECRRKKYFCYNLSRKKVSFS